MILQVDHGPDPGQYWWCGTEPSLGLYLPVLRGLVNPPGYIPLRMEDDLLAFGNLAAVYHCDRRLGSLGGDAVDKTQHP